MLIVRDKSKGLGREQYTLFGWSPLSERRYKKAIYGGRVVYFASGNETAKVLGNLMAGVRPVPTIGVHVTPDRKGRGYSRANYERDLEKFERMEMELSAEILRAEQSGTQLLPSVILGVQAEIDTLRRKAKARLLIGRMRAMDKVRRRTNGGNPSFTSSIGFM